MLLYSLRFLESFRRSVNLSDFDNMLKTDQTQDSYIVMLFDLIQQSAIAVISMLLLLLLLFYLFVVFLEPTQLDMQI